MAALIDLRTAVYNAINTKKTANGYIYNDFNLDWTYVPITDLEEMPAAGNVWVIGLASEDGPPASRTAKGVKKEVPIQIAIQRQVDASDKATIDTMITLEEQLRDTVRLLDPTAYQWLRTEPLKDESGTPFSFMSLKQGFFEAYFTAFFLVILQ